jgi:hypothetical protein
VFERETRLGDGGADLDIFDEPDLGATRRRRERTAADEETRPGEITGVGIRKP